MRKLSSIVVTFALCIGVGCGSDSAKKSENNANNTNNAPNNTNNSNNANNINNTNNTSNNQMTEFGYPIAVGTSASALDLMMVIDNSGSMCRYQRILQQNSGEFFRALAEREVDFQIGITTTQMEADYSLEPVARPGRLQSTPQPIPGFDRACLNGVNDTGQIIDGDFSPIRESISVAVDCMENPDPQAYQFTDAEIECAAFNMPAGCAIASVGCGSTNPCALEDLFPPSSSYRELPKILKSEDYRSAGGLDLAAMQEDFTCMSMVGSRGFGIEEGLEAAVTAVSPGLTGGTVENPTDTNAPNHGLLRAEADFGVMFITDEGDCSNDNLDFQTVCGGDVCYYSDSELTDIGELQSRFLENLRLSKGDEALGPSDVYVASLHGGASELDTVFDEQACEDGDTITPVCRTPQGEVYNGIRYSQFVRQFPASNIFPKPSPQFPDGNLTGWMCNGDFSPTLPAIADVMGSGSCFGAVIAECSGDCPADPFTGTPGVCTSRTDEMGSYCTSQVQVRAVAPASVIAGLTYCIPESVEEARGGESFCTIDKSNYELSPCASGAGAFTVDWLDPTGAINALAGARVFVYDTAEE